MPTKSRINDFEPVHLKHANDKLDKHVLSANAHKKTNEGYKKNVFKESLWHKVLGFFKK